MTRTGKIARLPHSIRHELNLRLQNGDPTRTILAWLNARPDVQAILEQHFRGQPIRQQNLSRWHLGGYQDWLLRQDALEMAHPLSDDAHTFAAQTLTPLPSALTHWLALRYTVATRQIATAEGPDALKLLHRFGRDILHLHRTDILDRREQRQRDRLTFQQDQAREKTAAHHEAWLLHPDNRTYINQLWKETYPNDFVSDSDEDEDDEENENQSEDVDHESEKSSADQSNEASVDHPGEDDPTAHRCRDDRTPEQKARHPAIYVKSPGSRAPIGRTEAHPPRPLPPPTPNTNATPGDDEPTDTTEATAPSAIGHLPSAIPSSPTHPVTKSPSPASPRKPSPTDSARETVARLLDSKGFAKYGLDVFHHIPLPEEAKKLLSAKFDGHSG